MLKRKFLLPVAVLGAALACACAKAPDAIRVSEAPKQKHLTIATFLYGEMPHRKVLNTLVETYNQAHPDILLEIDSAPYSDYDNSLTSEILAHTEADIIQVYPAGLAWYDSLREGGAFLDLRERCAASGISDGLTGQALAQVDGRVLALSNYAWGIPAIYYRRSILSAAGIDPQAIRTQEDFRNVCLEFSGEGRAALAVCYGSSAYAVDDWCSLLARTVSDGVYFQDGDAAPYSARRLRVNSEENIWAAQWWNDFIAKDRCALLVLEKKDARELFWNGEVPFCVDEPSFIAMCQEYGDELVADIGVIPLFNVSYQGRIYRPRPALRPVLSCISARCPYPEEAWDFLSWMAGEEAQRIIAECGLIPAGKAYSADARYADDHPLSARFMEILIHNYRAPVPEPATPAYARLREILQNAAMEMFSQTPLDVRPILDQAQADMAEVLQGA